MLTVLVAAAPSVVLLSYFYLRDRYDREPLHLVALAYALGMYSMLAADGLTSLVEGFLPPRWLSSGTLPARLFDAFVMAGFLEELAKWTVFIAAVYPWRQFDEPLDGIVYGVAVSLGFATLENFLFLDRLGLGIAWQRSIFAVPAHALFGGAMGYYGGRGKVLQRAAGPVRARNGPPWREGLLAVLAPTAFHGAYDFALLHGLGWKIWVAITVLSVCLWVFVLRRVGHAAQASQYRPKTMPPTGLRR